MRIDATPAEAQTILKAMRAVAGSGAAITAADRASIVAAARYIFQIELSPDDFVRLTDACVHAIAAPG